MHCAACELLIEKKLSKVDGIKKVDAKLNENKVYIETEKELNVNELSKLVKSDGYKIVNEKIDHKKIELRELAIGFIIALTFASVFMLIQKLGIINLTSTESDVTLPFVFMIGIVASLSTCMAVVGGLVLSLSSQYSKGHQFKPLIIFHLSRIIGFSILGGFIGIKGSGFLLTPMTNFIINLILFAVMIIMSVNLLEVLPFAKKLQLRIPKFLGKYSLKVSESNNSLTPILLGVSTFILPCGFTQSMQI
jgi:copper chaperone CopZ